MRCPRCGGLIVREDMAGVYEGGLSVLKGWRCVNCGAIGDFVIQGNQRRMAHLLVGGRASSTSIMNVPIGIWKAGNRAREARITPGRTIKVNPHDMIHSKTLQRTSARRRAHHENSQSPCLDT